MSRLSFGFLATALVIALGLASIQIQLAKAGLVPAEDTHSGH